MNAILVVLLLLSSNSLTPVVTGGPPNVGHIDGLCASCSADYLRAVMVVRYRIDAGDHNIWYISLGQFVGTRDGAPLYRAPLKIYVDEWEMYSRDGCLLLEDVEATIINKTGEQVPITYDEPANHALKICTPRRQLFLPTIGA